MHNFILEPGPLFRLASSFNLCDRYFCCFACAAVYGKKSPESSALLLGHGGAVERAYGWVCTACGTIGTFETAVRLLGGSACLPS